MAEVAIVHWSLTVISCSSTDSFRSLWVIDITLAIIPEQMTPLFESRFRELSSPVINCKSYPSDVWDRQFRAHFGISLPVCSSLWAMLVDGGKLVDAKEIYLLWTLFFWKHYVSEDVISSRFKTTSKTLRKWVWILIDAIGELEVVNPKTVPNL